MKQLLAAPSETEVWYVYVLIHYARLENHTSLSVIGPTITVPTPYAIVGAR